MFTIQQSCSVKLEVSVRLSLPLVSNHLTDNASVTLTRSFLDHLIQDSKLLNNGGSCKKVGWLCLLQHCLESVVNCLNCDRILPGPKDLEASLPRKTQSLCTKKSTWISSDMGRSHKLLADQHQKHFVHYQNWAALGQAAECRFSSREGSVESVQAMADLI